MTGVGIAWSMRPCIITPTVDPVDSWASTVPSSGSSPPQLCVQVTSRCAIRSSPNRVPGTTRKRGHVSPMDFDKSERERYVQLLGKEALI